MIKKIINRMRIKKKFIEELQDVINQLEEENVELLKENERLKHNNLILIDKNNELIELKN